jgi:hypothetical protein
MTRRLLFSLMAVVLALPMLIVAKHNASNWPTITSNDLTDGLDTGTIVAPVVRHRTRYTETPRAIQEFDNKA